MTKTQRFSIIFRLICFAQLWLAVFAFAIEKSTVLGGKSGWRAFSLERGITRGTGKFGYESIELAANARAVTEYTDLLIAFEDTRMMDLAGNYRIVSSAFLPSRIAAIGKGAGLAKGDGGLTLEGNPNALFGKAGLSGSFLIEFWLKPALVENGETVLLWRSSRTANNYPIYQMIRATFFNNALEWHFVNVFDGFVKNDGEITLKSRSNIVPEVWAHYSIAFDEETGMFEYRIDSRLEDIAYITTDGREGSEIFQPVLGMPAHLEICPQFTGNIDDLHISRAYGLKQETAYTKRVGGGNGANRTNGHNDVFDTAGGRFELQPFPVTAGSSLSALRAVANTPPETSVRFFVRGGDNLVSWTDSFPQWVPIEKQKPLGTVSGSYFQVAGVLYPDGAGTVSPSITEITLVWQETLPPLPANSVQAKALDAAVMISWKASVDDTVAGYFVYYGERSGEYLGRFALEGASPVNAGNKTSITLTGLQNGKVYYFAVAAYSKLGEHILGDLSMEVFARPERGIDIHSPR